MTEKRDLNNELILMKKTIQQAKVCVIGKLVRKLKNLTKQPGKELSGLKLIGKRGRLTDQINYLKKIPNLELATLALTFDKDPAKILTNQLSSIEDASLASIVTFKTVSVKVNQIKTRFGLNENGEGWRETVTEIGKKKKRKIEKETNQKRNKERKEAQKKSNELVKKRDEWLEEHIEGEGERVDERVADEENSQKSNVKRVKSEKKSTSFTVTDNKSKKVAKVKPTREPQKTADPFFITETGESYLATKVTDRMQPIGPNDGLDRKERRSQQFNGPSTKSTKPTTKRHSLPAGPSTSSSSMPKAKATTDDLHPSWAAKMKSKGIDKFQGKRIKFDIEDADDTANAVSKAPQPSTSTEDHEKIHPSWAAKQKLKPVITEFKGSKIVFDD